MNKNNITIKNKNECCGCSACKAICPKKAITMKEDSEGFLYPEINNEKCINCGICLKVCNNRISKNQNQEIKAYAVKNKDNEVLKKSSSGGVSKALCDYFIKNNGIVYGVIYDSNNDVIVERIDNYSDTEKLYGSKYVQANPKDTFSRVYDDLSNNKKVLYISTSCYVDGLKAYLISKKCDLDNLYTVDLVCHGTPSPKLFRDYINYLKNKYDFEHFEFRTKKFPWGYGSKNFGCTIYQKNGKEITNTIDSNLYLQLFFSNYCLRPHCHKCEFTNVYKPSDITIADYWGLKEAHSEFFDEKGVSAVLTHSKKGDELLKSLENIDYIESTIEKISEKQGNLHNPSPKKEDREDFWKLYNKKGFEAVCKKYTDFNFKSKLKR